MNAKITGPKRGEIGLAKFHRLIGYASAGAALCLMGASITALYWFAGVIGMPVPARVLVALAIEVMAASLAASATTAYRDGGRIDWSAWVGFTFFITVAAFANIMHVIVKIDTSIAPAWFPVRDFVITACVFAAACPLGGSWGVHRFGWLRAHGADAEWTDTDEGVIVQPRRAVATPAARPARKAEPVAAPTARVEQPPAAPPAPAPAAITNEEQARARALFDEMLKANPKVKPDASVIHKRAEVTGVTVPTTRKWVAKWWADAQQARADDAPIAPHLAAAPAAREDAEDARQEARHAASVA
jgi:hypothetical protein